MINLKKWISNKIFFCKSLFNISNTLNILTIIFNFTGLYKILSVVLWSLKFQRCCLLTAFCRVWKSYQLYKINVILVQRKLLTWWCWWWLGSDHSLEEGQFLFAFAAKFKADCLGKYSLVAISLFKKLTREMNIIWNWKHNRECVSTYLYIWDVSTFSK